MLPLQIPAATPRSPSPALPGAWPDLERARSNTSPTTKSAAVVAASDSASVLINPLNHVIDESLEHVFNFHQRLSLSLVTSDIPAILETSAFTPLLVSTSSKDMLPASSSIPSEESDLTRFTRHDTSTSLSGFANTSVSTAYTSDSTLEHVATAKLSCPKALHNTQSIHPYSQASLPTPTETSNSPELPDPPFPSPQSEVSSQLPFSRPQLSRLLVPSSKSPPSASQSLSNLASIFPTTPASLASIMSSSLAPSSPILFASSSSSIHVSSPLCTPARGPDSLYLFNSSLSSYEGSPSWETSYGSVYNDEDMLRIPSGTGPQGAPAIRDPDNLRRRSRSPSLTTDAEPMLTSLSLPGTLPSPGPSPNVSINPQLDPYPGTPWTPSFSPAFPEFTDPAVSSLTCGIGVEGHVIRFPTPSSQSLSGFTSAMPSLPQDDFSLMGTPNVELQVDRDSSAAEYAAAIMSSAWGFHSNGSLDAVPGDPLENVGANFAGTIHREVLSGGEDEAGEEVDVTVGELGGANQLELIQIRNRYLPREIVGKGVIGRVKNLGGKVKRFFSGKKKSEANHRVINVDIDVDVREVRETLEETGTSAVVSVEDPLIFRSPAYATTFNNQVSGPLPAPVGIASRTRKPRPTLTLQTYASAHPYRVYESGNTGLSALPVIHVSTSTTPSAPSYNEARPISHPHLTTQSKGKNKKNSYISSSNTMPGPSSRRHSLSALSNIARSMSPHTSPPITITRLQPKKRPRSTIALTSRYTSSEGLREMPGAVNGFTPGVLQPSSGVTPTTPPGLSSSSTSRLRSVGVGRPVTPLVPTLPQPLADAIKKKHRRFSLSAISNFAASFSNNKPSSNAGAQE